MGGFLLHLKFLEAFGTLLSVILDPAQQELPQIWGKVERREQIKILILIPSQIFSSPVLVNHFHFYYSSCPILHLGDKIFFPGLFFKF